MDPDKAMPESKSLRKRGKQILDAPDKTVEAIPEIKRRKKLAVPSEPHPDNGPRGSGRAESWAVAGFLTKLPDPSWIDIEMIGYWLNKCDTEHGEKCRRPFSLDPLTLGQAQWLIDVRKKCLTSAKPENRYACLSYVWGGASTFKTEKDKLNGLLEDNSLVAHWDAIPKTIRNTVHLVDQLGIKYLWVDCLCIIQDDAESKHDQIQAMSGIYANAYVTVIAGNGWDADHGLRGIQGVTDPRNLSTFLKADVQENLQPYSSIWYSRGWTFQEMIFSPRKIMFQYQLALWECNNDSWHESSLSTIPTPLKSSQFRPSISPWQSKIEISVWPDIQQYISLVHDYAQRKLTYGDDGLHAITSLLSVMSTSFSGGFITGLPEIFFDEALLWQPEEPMQQRRSSGGQLAIPSWSWAGWEGKIMAMDWKDNFHHLYLRKKSPHWTDPSWIHVAKNWVSDDPVLPVTRTVKWFYGQTLLERFPVKPSGHIFIKYMTDFSLPVPPGWTFSGLGYLFDEQKKTISAYPLPISSSHQVSRSVSARYLFCRTTRGFVKSTRIINIAGQIALPSLRKFNTYLKDINQNLIGNLNLNLTQLNFQQPKEETEFELVVISAGDIIGTVRMIERKSHNEKVYLHRFNIPDGFGWPETLFEFPLGLMANTTSTSPELHRIGIYHVLWIEWDNGVAYRRGLGRVFKKAWDRMATEEIDLVLG